MLICCNFLWACIFAGCILAVLAGGGVGGVGGGAVVSLPTSGMWTPVVDAPATDTLAVYGDWNPMDLASSAWRHRQLSRDVGRWFTSIKTAPPRPVQDWTSRAMAPFRSIKWPHRRSETIYFVPLALKCHV